MVCALLIALPTLLLFAALACGVYVGEETIVALRQRRVGVRGRPPAIAMPWPPRAVTLRLRLAAVCAPLRGPPGHPHAA